MAQRTAPASLRSTQRTSHLPVDEEKAKHGGGDPMCLLTLDTFSGAKLRRLARRRQCKHIVLSAVSALLLAVCVENLGENGSYFRVVCEMTVRHVQGSVILQIPGVVRSMPVPAQRSICTSVWRLARCWHAAAVVQRIMLPVCLLHLDRLGISTSLALCCRQWCGSLRSWK